MAKKRPGSGRSPSGPGRKPYVRKPPFGPEKAESLIERKFENTARLLRKDLNKLEPTIDTRIVIHRHADDTITADLDIFPLRPDYDPDDILMALHSVEVKGKPVKVLDQSAIRGAWLSVVFFNPPSAVDVEQRKDYKVTRGQLTYKTHSRRWMKDRAAVIIEQARTSEKNFYEAHGAKPSKIAVRVWWSPEAKRPKRAIDKKEKGEDDDS